ncbi:MAG: signal peptide peptidase SppA [Thermodesulfobacteriota bacterium]
MKKHPILFGLTILASIFFGLIVIVFIFAWIGDQGHLLTPGEKIGIVEINGLITDSKETVQDLSALRKNPQIKAIVVRIDSPGGIVGAAQEIYTEVKRAGQVKPVVASCGSIAASGGYYIAVGANKIIANPGTITGSIGVIMKFANAEELLRKIGLKVSSLKSGELKDAGSPTREMTAKEKAMVQGVIDDVQSQFVEVVASGRKMPQEKIQGIADGRIFSGRQAMELGLIDKLGNMEEAIAAAGQMAGLKEEPEVIYPKKKGISFWELILDTTFREGVLEGLFYIPYKLSFEAGLGA